MTLNPKMSQAGWPILDSSKNEEMKETKDNVAFTI